MNKLIALALVATLATITMPLPITAGGASTALEWDETGPVTCDDGSVVAQDEECPDFFVSRVVHPDGTVDRETCPLEDQYMGRIGWTIIVIPVIPFVILVPKNGIICDYGWCGTRALVDLVGGGGPS